MKGICLNSLLAPPQQLAGKASFGKSPELLVSVRAALGQQSHLTALRSFSWQLQSPSSSFWS